MDSKAQILAKAIIEFMRATYIPTKADAEMGKELENMALEILKEEKNQTLPPRSSSHSGITLGTYWSPAG
jgi:hypothetical protein